MSLRFVTLVTVALAAALAGAGLARWWLAPPGPAAGAAPPAKVVGMQRPEFTLDDLEGRPRQVGEWDGRVLLINFWATWCPPCRREMPLFADLQTELGDAGLTVVAIAIDEADAVREFVAARELGFPVLVGGADAIAAAQAYGNLGGALPYSVVVDRGGRVAARYSGEVTRNHLEPLLAGLL